MKYKNALILSFVTLVLAGCHEDGRNKNVISLRHIHKYGYDVSKEEWEHEHYPGQVLTMLRDGKTIVETYEDGVLHGPRTESYPHSQTVETLEQYEKGKLSKRVGYSVRGVPQKEEFFKSPIHKIATAWYPNGTPRSKEEYKEDLLVNGTYYTPGNEVDSRIENGTGERTLRNQNGDILTKEIYSNYLISYIETYYPNNSPHTAISYSKGMMHGEKKIFAMSGEPLSVENYNENKKHGLCTYFQNGCKFKEIQYTRGLRDGVEKHYIDGNVVVQETEYQNGIKHGPSIVYCDGSAKTAWYFDNEKVSKSKFNQLCTREDIIMSMNKGH